MFAPSLANNKAVRAVSGSNIHFSKILLQELELTQPGENLIFSPYSLVAVMAMAKAGARLNTAEQLQKVFQLPKNDHVLHEGFKLVLNALKEQKSSDFTLSTANRIYSMSGFQMKDEFLKILTDSYKSTIEQVDFSNNLKAAAKINSWVESETKKRIQNLISPDVLNGNTRLVLVNAIYFKGFWKTKFYPNRTSDGVFFLSELERIQVPFMQLYKKFRVGSLNGLKVVKIPYQGDRLSMLIYINYICFNAPTPIESFKRPSEVMAKLSEKKINLILPKFKMETTLSLINILQKLGLTDMFRQEKADFTGIANEDLFVSEVVQKAFIEVNEEGSEAAAATGMVMVTKSCRGPKIEVFEVNRPFYFQIVDHKTDLVLFQGKCHNPLKST